MLAMRARSLAALEVEMDNRITWHYDFAAALDGARRARRFVLADFGREQ